MNIVSLYKIVKALHLMNSPFAVILVDVAVNMPQAVFLFREFIQSTVPVELEEAAEIDGCGTMQKFFTIVFPLLKPVMATVIIIVTLNVWNEFMTPLLFLQHRSVLHRLDCYVPDDDAGRCTFDDLLSVHAEVYYCRCCCRCCEGVIENENHRFR